MSAGTQALPVGKIIDDKVYVGKIIKKESQICICWRKFENFNISKKYKQILTLIFVSLLFIGSINYLRKFSKKIGEKKSITKFLGSFVCILIAGITLLDIENI